ncbi:PilV family protein [Diaphorobacter aerolatus]|uniref:Type IV pilus modification protein PilV n=1 Tax=Diaphorobacter aerolatus TaxID=1288495 RepID=A0A7H0GFT0_9BURK|nr:hypothetical protein [Diaphorobacter aerolatus]QNP47146.1 hypothetical protein H9K75_12030 [Diaphorobacter aerolatus]
MSTRKIGKAAMAARGREGGFTLLESGIALLVVAIGMLGPLKMMAHAMASSSTANARSVAALQAASLASIIQSNAAYWRDGEGRTASITLKQGKIDAGSSLGVANGLNCDATGVVARPQCSPEELVGNDLVEWAGSLDAALPNPSGSIQCTQTTQRLTRCTVTVRWHERYVSGNGSADPSTSAATATASDSPRSFITHVSI